MIRSKEPFNREQFYQLIEKEDWDKLWYFLNSVRAVNVTEEDLRIAFAVLPEKYQFVNLNCYGNRFTVDFLREFRDRFTYRIFDCVRPKLKNSKIMEEFHHYFPDVVGRQMDFAEFTNVLRYKHDLGYIKKFIRRLRYDRIFNLWGNRQQFKLPQEEIDYLKEHAYETNWRHI